MKRTAVSRVDFATPVNRIGGLRDVFLLAVCGPHDVHPQTGLTWVDMPGNDEFDQRAAFFFHRRGWMVEGQRPRAWKKFGVGRTAKRTKSLDRMAI